MANTNAIQKAAEGKAQAATPKATMQQYIKRYEGEIAKALPSVITPERFTRIVLSAISTNPDLAQTTPQSFIGAMMTAAQLGVEPNTPLGQAYLIPYWNSKTKMRECQFQLGYKGLIDLAYRTGEVTIIQAHVVHENDEFTFVLGLEPKLEHVPARANRGNPTHVYAMFRTKDGGYGFEAMSMEDIRAHAQKHSKAYSSGPWQTNFEEMAKKTVLKKVLKYAPLKSDFVRGISADESIKTEISDDMHSVSNTFYEADEDDYIIDDETGEVKMAT